MMVTSRYLDISYKRASVLTLRHKHIDYQCSKAAKDQETKKTSYSSSRHCSFVAKLSTMNTPPPQKTTTFTIFIFYFSVICFSFY